MCQLLSISLVSMFLVNVVFCQDHQEFKSTFMVMLSKESTMDKIRSVENKLVREGLDIQFEDIIYSPDHLEEFTVSFHFECPMLADPAQAHTSTISLRDGGQPFPLHVVFIGNDCSNGTFSTSREELSNLKSLFFKDKPPSFTFHTWEGSFDSIF